LSEKVRVRFAPSPTGHLHIGSARTALFNYLFARHAKGSFILRIEDTDRERSADMFEKSILDDLSWLGLDWDEGPQADGEYGPYYQSQRQTVYQEAAKRLLSEGKAYYCYCSPEALEEQRRRASAAGKMPKYEGTCFGLAAQDQERLRAEGKKPTVRFHVPPGTIELNDLLHGRVSFASDVIGDFIILRSDGTASFNFAVVVDDALMKITHVIRGEDHLPNTPRHVLLCQALGYSLPVYVHHPLVMGKDGGKLSKRHGATSISEYRKTGYLPEAIANYLALLGWSSESEREIFELEELVGEFKLERLSKKIGRAHV
jgi:glutamyl-tRNA synthetase